MNSMKLANGVEIPIIGFGTYRIDTHPFRQRIKTHESIQMIDQQVFDKERALYGIQDASITNCVFGGPQDGESALKESSNLYVSECDFHLRYPFWHVRDALIENTCMTDTCRAALWYCKHVKISDSRMGGIKAIRECEDITIRNCSIKSVEFGWLTRGIMISHADMESEYPFFSSSELTLNHFKLTGKYSFQYVKNVEICNSQLDTKDAFWHSNNVTITDSVIKGEYLGWYSENLKLVRCRIIGTQPFCYARGLVLEDCEMINCDLAFERSNVHATISGKIDSIKNPISGHIVADSIGNVILNDDLPDGSSCIIEER